MTARDHSGRRSFSNYEAYAVINSTLSHHRERSILLLRVWRTSAALIVSHGIILKYLLGRSHVTCARRLQVCGARKTRSKFNCTISVSQSELVTEDWHLRASRKRPHSPRAIAVCATQAPANGDVRYSVTTLGESSRGFCSLASLLLPIAHNIEADSRPRSNAVGRLRKSGQPRI